ncbi:MAG: helix-turn-helix transcriptional regulator [Alphaproteobacteria bacterium]|nr:helix-turn-helix transcriptional regulator [Alphaproteobacteria bacterium]
MEEIIFPNQIRMIRRTRGKTMKEIAGILGVSLSAISKIEKGYRRIDEEQLAKISTFLNCPKESIFVYEKTSQPEVLQAWEKEKERRCQINEKSGLKTLGAGLRYLRGDKMLTLNDVAKGAGLTLSVYHRIEMGQREVTEDQFKKIAHALGFDPEQLQVKIYELDMAGTLQEFKKTRNSGIFHPKGGYNDLPLKNLVFQSLCVEVYDADNAEKPITTEPLSLPQSTDCFKVKIKGSKIHMPDSNLLTLLASKSEKANEGQLAVLKVDDHFEVGYVEKQSDFGLITEKGRISIPNLDATNKVVAILV